MLAKIENGVVTKWPLGEEFVQSENPDTSFSFPLTDDTLRQFGFVRFELSDPAEYDSEFYKAIEITPMLNGAVATQAWEIAEKYTANEKAAYLAQKLDAEKKAVRNERNLLLAESDWTQLADATVDKVSWAAYRQALRDLPSQAGFPHNVTWPNKPE